MGIRTRYACMFAALVLCGFSGFVIAQVNVTTYHNDIARTGQNTQETILTLNNVNSNQFGKLFSVTVDGAVYAQPLYLSAVSIGGGTHNVVYVATEHDSVYAIDADSGTIYAQASLIPAGGTTVNSSTDIKCTDVVPEVGITGTPVIDPIGGALYVVAKSKVSGQFVQYLHALSITDLKEKLNGPVQIQASVSGFDSFGSGGTVTFNPMQENQRPALLLENGHVVIAWAAHCDHSPFHGWVMSYNATTLAREAVFNGSPNGNSVGVWMSGGGIAADSSGNLYFATGNGTWNGTTDFGNSIVKLGPPANNKFPIVDYFTPHDQAYLTSIDGDVGSGGLVLLPTLSSGQQLLAQQSKMGTIYLLDVNNLGKYCPNFSPPCSGGTDPQIVQDIHRASNGVWGSPAYWNGNLYWAGANDPIRAYSFGANGGGLISTTPTSQSAQIFAFSAPIPVISSNGTTNGILWALDGSADGPCVSGSSCLGLYAYDATNLGKLLYASSQAANNRDYPGAVVKFETPIVANGKVYVGTQNALTAYGLLVNAPPVAAGPSFAPAPGSYSSAQTLTLSDTTPGAVIHYTSDGTTPTVTSATYSAPLAISTTTTIQAIAVANGYTNSAVAGGTYVLNGPSGGTSSVNLSTVANVFGSANNGTAVTNGGWDNSGYAYSANLLGTSITYAGSPFAIGTAGTADAVSNTTIPLPAGNYATLKLLGSATNGAQMNQAFVVTYTDGTTTTITQSLSDWWGPPQNFPGESQASKMAYLIKPTGATQNQIVYLYGYTFSINSAKTAKSLTLPANRHVVILAVDVTNTTPVAASPSFAPAPGSYSSAQTLTLSDATPGAVIHYTTDGTTPTVTSATYSAPLAISTTTTIQAIAVANGYTNSAVAGGTYDLTGPTSSVNLSTVANVFGSANNGTAVTNGGWDNSSYAYSANLLGTSITYAGSPFAIGTAGTADAVSNTTIPLPAGNYATLKLLGSATNGAQMNQAFVVTYTDGTTTTITQSLSDWWGPSQNFPGESQASKMAYLITPTGATQNPTVYLYGYTFSINNAKTVKSLTLPANRHVVILAVDVT